MGNAFKGWGESLNISKPNEGKQPDTKQQTNNTKTDNGTKKAVKTGEG